MKKLLNVILDDKGRPRLARFSREYVELRLRKQSDDVTDRLLSSKVDEDKDSITFNIVHPGWLELDKQRKMRRPERERVEWSDAAKRISHGIWGFIKSSFQIDRPVNEVMTARLEVCGKCEQNAPCNKLLPGKRCCGKLLDVLKANSPTCGCIIANKVKIASEECPLGKW